MFFLLQIFALIVFWVSTALKAASNLVDMIYLNLFLSIHEVIFLIAQLFYETNHPHMNWKTNMIVTLSIEIAMALVALGTYYTIQTKMFARIWIVVGHSRAHPRQAKI